MKYIKIILITLLTLTNLNVIKAEDKNIVSIQEIENYYSYEINTVNTIEQLNLPNELLVYFDDETSENIQVEWTGEIDFETIGQYQLTSSFIDYTYENMPVVTIELYEEEKDDSLLRNNPLSDQEPVINAVLTVSNGWGSKATSTEENAALFPYYYGYDSFPFLRYDIEAQGLKPNTIYDVMVGAAPMQLITGYFDRQIRDIVPQTITTDDDGNFTGICRFSLWNDYGEIHSLVTTTLFFTNQNDSEDKIKVSYDNHLLDYKAEAFDLNKTRLIDPEIGNNDSYTTVPLDKNEINDKYLDLEFTYYSYIPNQPYTFKAKLVKLNENGEETEFDETYTIDATTDEEGKVTATIKLGPYNDLEVGRYRAKIDSYKDDRWRRSYEATNRAQTNVYVYETLPEKGEVPIHISTLDDKGNLLPGAIVVLRRNDKDGEIVETWTSHENPHIIGLTPGTYYLEETVTPSPFDKPKSFTFEVDFKDEVTSEKTLVGESIEEDGFSKMYVYNDDFQDLVYCINYGKDGPSLINHYNNKTLNFYQHIADGEILRNYTVSKYDPDVLYNKVASIIWNGYPNNKTNIKEKYNLSDKEFEEVTQSAIHNFTDNYYNSSKFTEDMYAALAELIEAKTPAPEDMILNMYVADHSAYQNLIGATIRKIKIIEISYKHTKPVEPEPKPEPYRIPKTGD